MFFKKKNVISAGASGELIELCDVNDEVFSCKMVGEGYAVKNHNGIIYAPMSGVITTIFPSKHAITIESSNGTEMLIHIGIDTVILQGKPFEIKSSKSKTIIKDKHTSKNNSIISLSVGIVISLVLCLVSYFSFKLTKKETSSK